MPITSVWMHKYYKRYIRLFFFKTIVIHQRELKIPITNMSKRNKIFRTKWLTFSDIPFAAPPALLMDLNRHFFLPLCTYILHEYICLLKRSDTCLDPGHVHLYWYNKPVFIFKHVDSRSIFMIGLLIPAEIGRIRTKREIKACFNASDTDCGVYCVSRWIPLMISFTY